MERDDINVKPAAAVQVRLPLAYHGATRDRCLPAEIVHVSSDGVAIKFHTYDKLGIYGPRRFFVRQTLTAASPLATGSSAVKVKRIVAPREISVSVTKR